MIEKYAYYITQQNNIQIIKVIGENINNIFTIKDSLHVRSYNFAVNWLVTRFKNKYFDTKDEAINSARIDLNDKLDKKIEILRRKFQKKSNSLIDKKSSFKLKYKDAVKKLTVVSANEPKI